MAPGPGSFANPQRSHAGSLGAAKKLWWKAAAVLAEAVGCRLSQACNPSLRVGTLRQH